MMRRLETQPLGALFRVVQITAGLLLGACSGDPHNAGEIAANVEPKASIEVALAEIAQPTASLDRVATYGTEEAGGLTSVASMAVGKNGSLLVIDAIPGRRSAGRLVQFDSAGRFVRFIGRVGAGPGEFEAPSAIGIDRDSRILVLDAFLRRIVVFDSVGAFVAQWPLQDLRIQPISAGIVVDTANVAYIPVAPIEQEPDSLPTERWIRVTSTGAILDTVLLSNAYAVQPRQIVVTGGGRRKTVAVPFSPYRASALGKYGWAVIGRTDAFVLDLVRPSPGGVLADAGDQAPIRRLRRQPSAKVLSDSERRLISRYVLDALATVDEGASFDPSTVPKRMLEFSMLRVASDGRIWAKVFDQSAHLTLDQLGGQDDAEQLWDVYEPDGAFVGRLKVQAGVWLADARGSDAWGVEYSGSNVPTVVRYRINW